MAELAGVDAPVLNAVLVMSPLYRCGSEISPYLVDFSAGDRLPGSYGSSPECNRGRSRSGAGVGSTLRPVANASA